MRFLGGSDTDFFYAATDRGFKLIWVPRAIMYATRKPECQTFGYQVQRQRSVGASYAHVCLKRYGAAITILKKSLTPVLRLGKGMLGILGSPLFLLKRQRSVLAANPFFGEEYLLCSWLLWLFAENQAGNLPQYTWAIEPVEVHIFTPNRSLLR